MCDNDRKIYKNAIHNLGEGVAIFNTFLQNELVVLCMSS
jgi:zinc transporter ZupT